MFEELDKIDPKLKLNLAFVFSILALCLLFFVTVHVANLTGSYGDTLKYLDSHRDVIESDLLKGIINQANQQPNLQNNDVSDEFTLLSDGAKEYVSKVGKISGTPTFLIDGKVYMGFSTEYSDNLPSDVAYGDLLLNSKEVILYSSPTCGFCKKTEDFLIANSIRYIKVCAPIHPRDYDICSTTDGYIY